MFLRRFLFGLLYIRPLLRGDRKMAMGFIKATDLSVLSANRNHVEERRATWVGDGTGGKTGQGVDVWEG